MAHGNIFALFNLMITIFDQMKNQISASLNFKLHINWFLWPTAGMDLICINSSVNVKLTGKKKTSKVILENSVKQS